MQFVFQLATSESSKIPRRAGIYEIRTTCRQAKYIGSSVNLNKRFRGHLFKLMKGNHENRNLQKIFIKHKGILKFKVLSVCASYSLVRMEQIHLDRSHKKNS